MHNTLSNICCVGGIRCCVGGLPYTTHFQIYNACFVGSSRCVRGFTIRNTLSNLCCVGGKTCCGWRFTIQNALSKYVVCNNFLQS